MERLLLALAMAVAAAVPVHAQLKFNPNQVGILRWYKADQATTFAVGRGPGVMAFDGACIWVANAQDNTVTKMRALTEPC